MLRAFRIRLVSVTMLCISIVVLAITSAINISNAIRLRQRADSMLDLISEYNGTLPQSTTEVEGKIDFYFSQETPFQTRYFVLRFDDVGNLTEAMTNYIAAVSVDDIQRYAALTAHLKNKSRGSIGQYRYLVTDSSDGRMITFLDRSQDRDSAFALLAISIFTAVIGLSCILVIMIILSKKIVQPFIRNQEKQKEFITDAGHELKTPLAIIRTNAEVLEVCCGSAAMDLCYIACGRVDGYFEKRLKPWDYTAGIAILREAGGAVTALDGGEPSYSSPSDIAASNGSIHSELLSLIMAQ